ncbi:hypothetical protein Trisim1_007968 [Trichoderma cf. simile WF8]
MARTYKYMDCRSWEDPRGPKEGMNPPGLERTSAAPPADLDGQSGKRPSLRVGPASWLVKRSDTTLYE